MAGERAAGDRVDVVLEEPEADVRVAVVGEPVEPEGHDLLAAHLVQGGIGVQDVVLVRDAQGVPAVRREVEDVLGSDRVAQVGRVGTIPVVVIALSVLAKMFAQSSPVPSSLALPSSWKALPVGDAETAAGAASEAYCRSSEHKKSAVHSKVKPLRVLALTANQSPRDI